MRVIAKTKGFYRGERKRPGDVFDMAESAMKKGADGKPVLPAWVAPADKVSKAEIVEAKKAADDKFVRGAQAASGGAAAKKKVETAGQAEDLV